MIVEAAFLVHIADFLCDSKQSAIQFEDKIAELEVKEVAANELARQAGRQVCGYYSGDAAVASETRIVLRGVVYLVTEFVFEKDNRTAIGAQRVFDAGAGSHSQDI